MSMLILVSLVGASVSYVMATGLRVLGAALRSYRERYGLKGPGDLLEFLLCVDTKGIRALAAGVSTCLALVGMMAGGMALGAIGAGIGWIAPGAAVRWQRKRWRLGVEGQLVSTLEGLTAALRGGLSLVQALEQLSSETSGPLGRELRLLVRELKVGHSIDASLEALAARVESAELDLTVAAISLSRQLGGNLAEMLQRISETLRERFRLEGKVLSLTAQGRMQGRIVASMPLGLGLILWWMRPDLVEPMVQHSFGQLLLATVAILEVAGLLWMQRLVKVDV